MAYKFTNKLAKLLQTLENGTFESLRFQMSKQIGLYLHLEKLCAGISLWVVVCSSVAPSATDYASLLLLSR